MRALLRKLRAKLHRDALVVTVEDPDNGDRHSTMLRGRSATIVRVAMLHMGAQITALREELVQERGE
jgi:hypothetical protein